MPDMSSIARRDHASRWIIVVAAIIIVGFGVGALFSLAVFLKPMQESMAWGRAAISAVALWMWVAYGTGSLMWGVLADRWGARRVVIAGGVLLGLGLVASSRITSLWQLYAAFGGVVGVAAGAFYAPLTTTVTRWFTANRGLAVALVSAGTGLGTFIVAPLTRWLISSYDWRLAMLILGDIVWLVIIPLGFLVRDAPGEGAGPTDQDVPVSKIFRSPQFWLIALTHFTCCVAHSGPIFHMTVVAAPGSAARGPHECAKGFRACPTGAWPQRRALGSVIVAAAISYDRKRAD